MKVFGWEGVVGEEVIVVYDFVAVERVQHIGTELSNHVPRSCKRYMRDCSKSRTQRKITPAKVSKLSEVVFFSISSRL